MEILFLLSLFVPFQLSVIHDKSLMEYFAYHNRSNTKVLSVQYQFQSQCGRLIIKLIVSL